MNKPLADSTLMNMTKNEIIEHLRVAEHNHRVCEETIDQQYKNFIKLLKKERTDAFDELVKAMHPCNKCPSYKYDCDNNYFEETCDTEKSISWNELRIVADELKEQKK